MLDEEHRDIITLVGFRVKLKKYIKVGRYLFEQYLN